MHGTEQRDRRARSASPLGSPTAVFPATGSMLPDTPPAVSPVRTGSLVTAFRSPATAALSTPPFRGQRSWPATSLPSRRDCRPFGSFGSATMPGLPRTWPLHRLNPVAAPAPGSRNRSAGSTPLRDFYIPRDQSVQTGLAAYPARLTNPPDFPSLPAADTVSRLSYGSSFQVRYVSVGLLFLKPLGTFFTMLPKSTFGQTLLCPADRFSTTFMSIWFQALAGAAPLQVL